MNSIIQYVGIIACTGRAEIGFNQTNFVVHDYCNAKASMSGWIDITNQSAPAATVGLYTDPPYLHNKQKSANRLPQLLLDIH